MTSSTPHGSAPPGEMPSVLHVMQGLHRGAKVPLQRPGLVVLGSSSDCDLILMDTGVAAHHAAITLHEHEVAVRALDSSLDIDGATLEPGDTAKLRALSPLVIGGATLTIGDGEAPEIDAGQDDSGAQSGDASRRRSRGTQVATWLAGAGALLGLIVTAHFLRANAMVGIETPEKRINGLLHELKLEEDIELTWLQPGVLALKGTAPNEASHSALVRALAAEGLKPVLRVSIGEHLAAAVKDVFRVNGLDVETQYTHDGVVLVHGISKMDVRTDPVVQHALKDVPGLSAIRISGQRAKLAGPPLRGKQEPRSAESAAKRVVSVVDGSPSYLVTADGARYFVGSLLPQGHRVLGIKGTSVTLERDGERLVMTF